MAEGACRRLVLVLGDQLWLDNPALARFDPALDCVLMIEAASEATHVWSHKARIAVFLSAMRHFRQALQARGLPVRYFELDEDPLVPGPLTFAQRLQAVLAEVQPEALCVCEAGEWRLARLIEQEAARAGVPLQVSTDPHFICSREAFAAWARGRPELRMEDFYRHMRRRFDVLMEGDRPAGQRWNFDADNRHSFGARGPGLIPEPLTFAPDELTLQVLAQVEQHFPDHPGSLDNFGWPLTREHALEAMHDFVAHRLAVFGPYQDAMWTATPWGWHAVLSSALNLHLLDPREVLQAVQDAWRAHRLPLASVEGFVRQILGWREFVHGMYWLDMPRMSQANHFGHQRDLPAWYWTGDTRMACMRAVIGQTLAHGFAHHIQRLMVTGQFALLAEVTPSQVCDWYLAVYVDAVEWVELPNTAGLALFADGGRLASKPYIASGQYIQRMSNYCDGCAYRPAQRSGEGACPVTALYWHFLIGHEAALLRHPRTAPMVMNLAKLSDEERASIGQHASYLLENLDRL